MPRQQTALLLIVSFLLADFAVLGQASRKAPVQAPFRRSMDGTIVLGGGYFDQENTAALLKTTISLAGGAGISLVIIPTADSQLEPLKWLIGSWENNEADQTVETKVEWAGNKNFLVRTFKLKGVDESETDGWEIVGWDPGRRQIHSWIFDSNGGFGESTWAYHAGHWLILSSNVLPDGSRSTAENVLTKADDNEFTWESQNRTLNGESQPSIAKIVVHRTTSNP